MKTSLLITLSVVSLAALSFYIGTRAPSQNDAASQPVENVTTVSGKQIIEIHAKGGYQPRKSSARAGIPTVLRFVTDGTFDCSSTVRIPSMNISQTLPQSGATDIALNSQAAGTLQGTCGMGMYRFSIDFL